MTLVRGSFEILLNTVVIGMAATQFWAGKRLLAGERLLPVRPCRQVPWSFASVILVVLLYLGLGLVVRLGYEFVKGPTPRPPEAFAKAVDSPGPSADLAKASEPADLPRKTDQRSQGAASFTELMVLLSVVNGLSLVMIPWVLRLTSRATLEDLGLSLARWKEDVRVGAVAFLLVTPWVYAIHALALKVFPPSQHPLEKMLRQEFTPGVALLAIVSAVIFAPASEEMIFRGVLLGWLGRSGQGSHQPRQKTEQPFTSPDNDFDAIPEVNHQETGIRVGGRSEWSSITASALPFALVHATEMPAPIPIFFLAFALGYVVRRSGSLIPGLVLHGLFNGCSTLMLLGSVL